MTKITKAQAVAAVRSAIVTNPDAINPMDIDSEACVYHQGRGRNLKRCLVGQIGYDLRLPTPHADAGPVSDLVADDGQYSVRGVWFGLFTESAAQYLSDVQASADGANNLGNPRLWGEIPKSIVSGRG